MFVSSSNSFIQCLIVFRAQVFCLLQFSSALSCVWLFETPWITARQASLSITNSQSSPKLMSIKLVMPSSHLILCRPLLLLSPIPPSIRVFSNESTLSMKWSFSLSIRPSNEHPVLISFRMDWLDLLAVQGTLKSLLQHHSSKASILRHSAFFTVNSHIRTWPLEKPCHIILLPAATPSTLLLALLHDNEMLPSLMNTPSFLPHKFVAINLKCYLKSKSFLRSLKSLFFWMSDISVLVHFYCHLSNSFRPSVIPPSFWKSFLAGFSKIFYLSFQPSYM